MNSACRTARALGQEIYGVWRRACLRQARQLNCNPLGIIVAIAVMVGTVEVWNHGRDLKMWAFLIAAPAVIALITLAIVRLLHSRAVVSWPRHQPSAQARPRPSLPQLPVPDPGHDEPARSDQIVEVAADNGLLVLHADGVERLDEPERAREPV
jgi:hypothetical protein